MTNLFKQNGNVFPEKTLMSQKKKKKKKKKKIKI